MYFIMTENLKSQDTIVAISTATGGALCVVRLSGAISRDIVQHYFSRTIQTARHAYFGLFSDGDRVIDEVVVTWFAAPASFTGEDMVEISCHGSRWISSELVRVLISAGARSATAGEFTQRAFLNGKMNLSQAEAVGDLIASSSRAAAEIALTQMRGGYTDELSNMRDKLLHISSMLELELDFSEEDVEFASRDELVKLLTDLRGRCDDMARSFALGNVLKNGVPVAIIGKPNVGKSTLLNALVGDDRAIVSEIAGTTRDYLEEVVNIDGVEFRFIDTAGIRHTVDQIEAMGVERSMERMRGAKIILQIIDCNEFMPVNVSDNQRLLIVQNKFDVNKIEGCDLHISAKYGLGIDALRMKLLELSGVSGYDITGESLIVSNLRHFEALQCALQSINEALDAVESGLSSDLLVSSLSAALRYLGDITGEFTTDEILGNIFKNFCIGK